MSSAVQHDHNRDETGGKLLNRPVVVVEDDEDDGALLQREVRDFSGDLPLLVFRTGAELFGYLDRAAEKGPDFFARSKPRVILLDMQMPGENGIEVLKRLRAHERYADIPVMVVSGTLDENKIAEAEKYGVSTFVSKPISVLDLMDTLGTDDEFI
jgi:CheY-like chemotaxis protein